MSSHEMHRLTHMYHENKNKKLAMQEGSAIMIVIAIIVITIVRNENQPCLVCGHALVVWSFLTCAYGHCPCRLDRRLHTGVAPVLDFPTCAYGLRPCLIVICIRALHLCWISPLLFIVISHVRPTRNIRPGSITVSSPSRIVITIRPMRTTRRFVWAMCIRVLPLSL